MNLWAMMFVLTMFSLPGLGQSGLYGPVIARSKAGTNAPELVFEKVLAAPRGPESAPGNLTGHLTVLGFFPDTTDNPEAVTKWNSLAKRFAGKNVQFIWITGEEEDTLVPWLAEHPVRSWVVKDTAGKTGNAYGLEIPENVILGRDGKILGFLSGLVQAEQAVRAAEDGRTTTIRPTKATLQAYMTGRKVFLEAEPRKMPGPEENRPRFAPSSVVHVTPSQTDDHSNSRADDFWSLQGYTLLEALEELYGVNAARVRMPASFDLKQHYDFGLVLPGRESRDRILERMRIGVLEHFHVSPVWETLAMDVYVLSAAPGRRPPLADARDEGLDFVFESIEAPGESDDWKPVSLGAVRGVAWKGTIVEFCHQFEANLDKPVVDETGLKGNYRISISAGDVDRIDFQERLRAEAGLVLTPAARSVEILVLNASTP